MYRKFFRFIQMSCILVFIPLLANAELSTKDAWDNLKKLLETGGYQVIGQENLVGSDLGIKNVQISFEVDAQTNINFDIGSLNLTKNKDGFINKRLLYLSLEPVRLITLFLITFSNSSCRVNK